MSVLNRSSFGRRLVGAMLAGGVALSACSGRHTAGSLVPQSADRRALGADPSDTLYVSGASAVYAFPLGASGTVSPSRTITPHPNQTGLSIAGIATDVSGQLAILQNNSGNSSCQVVIEPSNANAGTLKSGQFACNTATPGGTGYVGVTGIGIARDPSGVAYLESVDDATQNADEVQRANTDTAPAGTASTGPTDNGGADGSSYVLLSGALSSHGGIAEGSDGQIFVSSTVSSTARVERYSVNADGPTPAKFVSTVSGRVAAGALAVYGSTLYVATRDGSGKAYVDAVSTTGSGAVTPSASIGPFGYKHVTALAVDAQGNIYAGFATNAGAPGYPSTDVAVYAPGANGKPSPLRTLVNPVPSGQSITALAIAQAPYSAQPAPSPAPSASPAVTNEYPTPTSGAEPYGITAGPDNALWFTEYVGQIGRIATGGTITEYTIPTSGSGPVGITEGSDGALWFVEYTAGQIGRITTGGTISEYTIPTSGSEPNDIAAGSDGALWFTEYNGDKIGRVTTGGTFTEYTIPTSASQPTGIAAGPDGALWFTEYSGNKIGRITTGGSFTEYTIPTASAKPYRITAGPDGTLWFVEFGGNKIGRITTGGTITEYTVPTSSAAIEGIAAGSDGALWFTENGANQIGRITTSGTITEYPIPTSSAGLAFIAGGPDGALWFAEFGANQIGRIK